MSCTAQCVQILYYLAAGVYYLAAGVFVILLLTVAFLSAFEGPPFFFQGLVLITILRVLMLALRWGARRARP
jgi:hypothetical protein